MNSIKLPSPSNNNTIQDFEKDFLLSTGGDNPTIVQPVPYQESTVTTTLSTSQTQTWKNLFPFPKMTLKTKLRISNITSKITLEKPEPCPICLHDKLDFRRTQCNHIFCSPCLEQWLAKHSSCPLCKRQILH